MPPSPAPGAAEASVHERGEAAVRAFDLAGRRGGALHRSRVTEASREVARAGAEDARSSAGSQRGHLERRWSRDDTRQEGRRSRRACFRVFAGRKSVAPRCAVLACRPPSCPGSRSSGAPRREWCADPCPPGATRTRLGRRPSRSHASREPASSNPALSLVRRSPSRGPPLGWAVDLPAHAAHGETRGIHGM